MRESVKEKKVQKRYDEEFKRQAVEPVIHSGKTPGADRPGTGYQRLQSDVMEKGLPWTSEASATGWRADGSRADVREDSKPAEGKRISQAPT